MLIPKLPIIFLFCYLLHTILKNNIKNVSNGIALRIRRIFETDEKFNNCSEVYRHYLMARGYNPRLVDKLFERVEMMFRNNAKRKNTKIRR